MHVYMPYVCLGTIKSNGVFEGICRLRGSYLLLAMSWSTFGQISAPSLKTLEARFPHVKLALKGTGPAVEYPRVP